MDTYTVRAGDTLNFIAYKHNTTVQKLIELNPNLKDNFLYLGQTIRIKQRKIIKSCIYTNLCGYSSFCL